MKPGSPTRAAAPAAGTDAPARKRPAGDRRPAPTAKSSGDPATGGSSGRPADGRPAGGDRKAPPRRPAATPPGAKGRLPATKGAPERPARARTRPNAPAEDRTVVDPERRARRKPPPQAGPPTQAAPAVPRRRADVAVADATTEAGRPQRRAEARPATAVVRRGRRVKRVVRRIELWSVLKLSVALFTCLYVAVLLSLVVIWNLAYQTGQIDRLQSFLADVGLTDWRFYGDRMFKACMAIGAVGVLAGSILAVLTTALVNLVSEITGGIRFVVIEEDVRPQRR